MKNIAIPTDGKEVSQHFGHCPQFFILGVEGVDINERKFVDNPGHRPDFLPGFLNELGVDSIIAGGMGTRAINLFKQNDIEVITGAAGSLDGVVEEYLSGKLVTEENICDH